ncbi:MAG: acetylxylan esterase [Acidobacteriaceae bacterium]
MVFCILRKLAATAGLIFLTATATPQNQTPQTQTPQTQAPQTQTPPAMPSEAERAAIAASSRAERDRELKLLGIGEMQPPASAYDIGKPGNANYDESKANPYPKLPDVLTMNDGTKVTTATQWAKRRAEIQAAFDEDVYGKFPANIPTVTWKVDSIETTTVQGIAATVKHVTGHVDNSFWPAIAVEIHADVVTPASAKGKKVPVIIGGGSIRPRPVFARPPAAPGQVVHMLKSPPDAPDSAKLLLQHGWGFVGRNSNDVQADNGAGLDKGIIGLVNKGQPRSLEDWGVLRAWGWGDSRLLDYLETDPDVDATKVGVMGHSRGGKAALVAMADDARFAIGFISSSGAGGADLYRRNYGETIGNLAGASEFHWFAGNFLKYAAAGHSANEMPVDSHEFLALVAPRPVFIGGGALLTDPVYVPGDAWQDAQGMFMAAVAASPVWDLLGAKGLGTTTFPPMGTFIDTGDVAFRQHEYGHTPAPNWPYFIEFAEKEFAKSMK